MIKQAFIFDLEGTLSFSNWREDHIPNWLKFESLFKYDPCNERIASIAREAWNDGHTVIILTGKMIRGIDDVRSWLKKNNINYTWIHMRSNDDTRPSEIYKGEYMLRFSPDEIAMIFDDRKKIISHLSDLGYPVFHVKGGQND